MTPAEYHLMQWKIDHIVRRVRKESPFVEKSEYTIETLRRVLEEEFLDDCGARRAS